MSAEHMSVITGAFGFSGSRIAELLLAQGEKVRTLTNHPDAASGTRKNIEAAPLDFGNPDRLAQAMAGAQVLYNTYWVRFPYGGLDHKTAVQNTLILLRAARQAGVQRIVHVSITNPSHDSPLTYFKGKAEAEDAVRASGLSYGILRPAVLFGAGDILLNNIAWLLKRSPVFAIPGSGEYSLQPIFVDDFAALAVGMGYRTDSITRDAVGPETYTYEELVRLVRRTVGSSSRIVHLPPSWVQLASSILGRVVRDVVLTREEISGLMSDLLVSSHPALGSTSLRRWLADNARSVGARYASEIGRHYAPSLQAV
jgi:uncharacterized protein YbjT (DUF2867 family)